MPIKRWGLGAFGLWFLVTVSVSAQIVTANGAVVSPRSPSLKTRLFLERADNAEVYGLRLFGTWGLTRQDELRVIVPVQTRDFLGQSDTGLGDIGLRYKRSLWQVDGVMTSDRLALLVDTTAKFRF